MYGYFDIKKNLGRPPKLRGFVCVYHLRSRVRIPSKPSMLSSIYIVLIVIAKRKTTKINKRGRDWPFLKKKINVPRVTPNLGWNLTISNIKDYIGTPPLAVGERTLLFLRA